MKDKKEITAIRSRTVCAACGMPGHRYGRNEGMERFDPQACINGLLAEIQRLHDGIETAMKQLAEHAVHERDGVALDIACDLLALAKPAKNGS